MSQVPWIARARLASLAVPNLTKLTHTPPAPSRLRARAGGITVTVHSIERSNFRCPTGRPMR